MPIWLTIILSALMLINIYIASKNKQPEKKKVKYIIIALLGIDVILLIISIL